MKKFLVNTRYFSAPMLILAALFGVLAGGPWVWTGVVLLGLAIIGQGSGAADGDLQLSGE